MCFCLEKSEVECIRLVSLVVTSGPALETLRSGFQMAFLQPNLREIVLDNMHVASYLENSFAEWVVEISSLVESLGLVRFGKLSCWNTLLPKVVSEGLKSLDLSSSQFVDVTESLRVILEKKNELEGLILQGIPLTPETLEVLGMWQKKERS